MVSKGISKESLEASATYTTLDDWIAREAIPFSVDSPRTFNAAVDKVIASLGDSVELLGFGEALHGGKDILILRNWLFQRLGLPTSEIAALPTRSGSMKNPTYFALTPQSFTDFDWLAVLDSTEYDLGGPPLQQ